MSPPFSWQLNSRWRHQNPRNSRIKGSPFSSHRVTGGEGLVHRIEGCALLPTGRDGYRVQAYPCPPSVFFSPPLLPSFPSLSLQYVLASRQLVAAYINVFGWFRDGEGFEGWFARLRLGKKTRIQLVFPSRADYRPTIRLHCVEEEIPLLELILPFCL